MNLPPRRILVIQLRHLGDALVTTPAVRALRRAYPHAQIDFLVDSGSRAVLLGNPDINHIVERPSRATLREGAAVILKVRRARYDLVIDFQHKLRSAVITLCSGAPRSVSWGHTLRRAFYRPPVRRPFYPAYMGRIKIDLLRDCGLIDADVDESPRPYFAVSRAAHEWASAELSSRELSSDNVVVAINPGARRPENRWAGLPALARRIVATTDVQLLVLWGPGERELAEHVVAQCGTNAVLAPASSIEQLGALLARCALLIGNDSGARHIGVAMGTPTLTISKDAEFESWTYPTLGHRCIAATIDGGGDAALERIFSTFEEVMREPRAHA